MDLCRKIFPPNVADLLTAAQRRLLFRRKNRDGSIGLRPADWREWRRFRALYLKQRGWYQRDIAEALDVSEEARQPLAGPCPRRRPRGPARPPRAGPPAQALGRPKAPDPRVPLARAGGVRLPRPGLDLCPRRPGHRGGVRRPLPQGPRRRLLRGTGLDAPAADQAGHPAGRGGDPTLAGRDLAGVATAGAARAPGPGFRGRIGVLPAPGAGQDVLPPRARPRSSARSRRATTSRSWAG